jgi:DNA-binding HxlR family transcriptional regulator
MDLLGERWTMLVVRELLLGPKRFSDLQAALPGISTNLLSARLQSLVAAGVAEPIRLPPPASVGAYGLTERGERLRPAVEAFAVWGFELLDPLAERRDGYEARGSWLASTLAAATEVDPEADPLLVNLDVDGDRFTMRLGSGRVQVQHGASDAPDGELTCSLAEFFGLARGTRQAEDPAVSRLFALLGTP